MSILQPGSVVVAFHITQDGGGANFFSTLLGSPLTYCIGAPELGVIGAIIWDMIQKNHFVAQFQALDCFPFYCRSEPKMVADFKVVLLRVNQKIKYPLQDAHSIIAQRDISDRLFQKYLSGDAERLHSEHMTELTNRRLAATDIHSECLKFGELLPNSGDDPLQCSENHVDTLWYLGFSASAQRSFQNDLETEFNRFEK